jgi:D-alanyl-D-alanine dipeptidase
MGTGFDCFSAVANTANTTAGPTAMIDRRALLDAMVNGTLFLNIPSEWWHFTLINEPFPDTYYDFPVVSPNSCVPDGVC